MAYSCCFFCWLRAGRREEVICYGTPTNDLMKLLDEEGYQLRIYPSVHEALQKAPKQAGVLLLSKSYPREGVKLDEALTRK
ncbi:hypothetical protein NXX60_06505 [Bacteroides thetaiotaomicron]|nr:hypothetical protein NXX60_06505 [Bacteroides thetaiotaomicron]